MPAYPGPPARCAHTDWRADPFARGAYSYWRVGAADDDVDAAAKPHASRVFFAGEHASVEYQGSACGALDSALRTARDVVDLLRREGA